MKKIRAIVLLIIYTSFIAGAALTRHDCNALCTGGGETHISYSESNTSFTECAEKEVKNVTAEHRAGHGAKFTIRFSSFFRQINSGEMAVAAMQFFNAAHSPENYSPVPVYIRHCTYRL